MDRTSLLNNLEWITAMDPEPEVVAYGSVLYADFYATVTQVAKHEDRLHSVDLYAEGEWFEWSELTEDELEFYPEDLQRFRYILEAG